MSEAVVPPGRPIKLVVWDLDETLWRRCSAGAPALHPLARSLIAALDERGIMQSAVTRDEPEPARIGLARLGLTEFFLHPQLGTPAKSQAVQRIASALNIRLDATLLIDDDGDEREEVARAHPEVRALAPDALGRLTADPLMGRSLAALEPRPRRMLYIEEQARHEEELRFVGSRDEFLASLGMQLAVAPATRADLHRVAELVSRPNQLGVTYSDADLEQLVRSPRHACLLVSLHDRFGDCGKVGLVLLEVRAGGWTLKLLLFSCRVLPRGVDAIVLHALVRQARAARASLVAEFRPTSKNESLLAAYRRAGFETVETRGDLILLTPAEGAVPPVPDGVRLDLEHAVPLWR